MLETLLVIGIHREELGFGDRVAALLNSDHIQVMRIPKGISHARTGANSLFYYKTLHREIYLQLWQQAKGHYRLLIDLHCGLNDDGRCADIYCRDERLLHCVTRLTSHTDLGERLRLVKILAGSEVKHPTEYSDDIEVTALTSIPEQIWNSRSLIYVGLEIYLKEEGEGAAEDWHFARDLIEILQNCYILYEKT